MVENSHLFCTVLRRHGALTLVLPAIALGCTTDPDTLDSAGDASFTISQSGTESESSSSGSSSDTDTDTDTEGTSDTSPSDTSDPPEECTDSRSYFAEQVYAPILKTSCFACHNINGAASKTSFILQGEDYPGFLEVNYNTFQTISALEIDGVPLVLRKPTLDGVTHGGGLKFEIDSEPYKILENMIGLFDAPVHCPSDQDHSEFYKGLIELDEVGTLRKATILLAGRLPTEQELATVEDSEEGLDQVLDDIMQTDAFYVRIKEIYNDRLLTDAYLEGKTALMALDPQRFPGAANAFAGIPEKQALANEAVAREPLNLIEYVLRTPGMPFTEILTANYTMVNGFSAMAYGIPLEETKLLDPEDPEEFIAHEFDDIPQAGVLTTTALMARYPNTESNRNRARSRHIFDLFLGQDVLQLAARPIDISEVQETNPTLFDDACTSCHTVIDPLAGAFQNYSFEGWYRPESYGGGWYGDMVPPGFNGKALAGMDSDRAVQWLGEEIIEDDGFAISSVYTIYEGLTGDARLPQPLDPKLPNYLPSVRAYDAQDAAFKEIAAAFIESDYDLRLIIKQLLTSPWVRAINVEGDELDEERATELALMGSARALPPEILDRKIQATIGFQWRRNGVAPLLSGEEYKFFYGGIDSRYVTTRLKHVNGVMYNIIERMSDEVACAATAADLSLPQGQRILFPAVSLSDEPVLGNGEQEIRENLRYLHARLLGERLDADDPEIDATFELFTTMLEHGRQGIIDEVYSTELKTVCQGTMNPITDEMIVGGITDDPDYKVRAWMSVITYLLGDYRFLYE